MNVYVSFIAASKDLAQTSYFLATNRSGVFLFTGRIAHRAKNWYLDYSKVDYIGFFHATGDVTPMRVKFGLEELTGETNAGGVG